MEALFLLAFAVGLGELAADWPLTRRPGPRALRAIPLAVLAASARSTPTASPGSLWLARRARRLGGRSSSRAPRGAGGLARVRAGVRPRRPGDARRARGCSPSSPRPRSGGWSTSRASRPSTPPARASATCSTGSRRSRRSGSGPPATSGSSPATGRCRRSSSTSAPRWRRGRSGLRAALVVARARARGPGGARRRGAAVALLAGRGHAVPGGEGAGPDRAAGDADLGPGAARASARPWPRRDGSSAARAVAYAFPGRARVAKLRLAGGVATVAFLLGAGDLEPARARQRAGRAERLLAGAGRAADGAPAGLDRGRRAPGAARRPARCATGSPGSCAGTGSAWSSEGEPPPPGASATLSGRARDDGAVVPLRRLSAPRRRAATARAP